MFADVSGSTALYRRLGDELAESLVKGRLQMVMVLTAHHSGELIKSLGDGLLIEFPSADAAACAALEIQRSTRSAAQADGHLIQFHIGFASGPVVRRDGDIFGDAVNIASRLCSLAKAGHILTLQETVDSLSLSNREATRLFDLTVLKGSGAAVPVVQLLWDRRAATEMFISPSQASEFAQGSLAIRYAGRTYRLSAAQLPISFGREAGCGIVVESAFASRVHARIELNRGKYTLVDESTNGTFVQAEGAQTLMYVRNEGFSLQGSGSICLGEKPAPDSPHLIHYQID